jgi:hypothetical protein
LNTFGLTGVVAPSNRPDAPKSPVGVVGLTVGWTAAPEQTPIEDLSKYIKILLLLFVFTKYNNNIPHKNLD